LLILASASILSLDAHFCQNKLKSISLLGQAKSCHDIAQKQNSTCSLHQSSCHKTADITAQKNDCCSNKTLVLSDENTQVIGPQINAFQKVELKFLISFAKPFISLNYQSFTHGNFQTYRPPLATSKSKQILFQTFLI
jgi:hypothetical protein